MNSFTSISNKEKQAHQPEHKVVTTYLRYFLIFALLLFVMVSSASYVIDPYGIWQTNNLFPRKVAAGEKVRQIKSYQGLKQAPEVLIVGNSRVQIGMPPDHPFYQGRVYNLGLPGASVVMQYDYAWHLIKTGNGVRQVLLAIDYADFLNAKPIATNLSGEWQIRLNYFLSQPEKRQSVTLVQTKEQLNMLFSKSAILDSGLTVMAQSMDLNGLLTNGFSDGRLYHHIVRKEGFAALYAQKIAELQQQFQRAGLSIDPLGRQFLALNTFLQLLKQQGIAVTIFINPYQYQYLDIIEKNGLQTSFHAWKSEMTRLASHYELPLYDFSIRSELVNSPAQLSSRQLQDNPYFWEPAHYRRAFGALMLDVFQKQDCDIVVAGIAMTICERSLPQIESID